MGFIHALYYYQVQKSIDDDKKEKEKKQEEERSKRPITNYKIGNTNMSNVDMKYGHISDHSPSSIIEQRRMREENRQNQNSSSTTSSNVSDVDMEEAFEDAMGG